MGEIGGAGKLIGLHTGKTDDRFRRFVALRPADAFDGNFVHGFVEHVDFDLHRFAQAFLGDEFFRQTCEACECIARQYAAPMADDVTVVVIL
jgi:hypothetical protein